MIFCKHYFCFIESKHAIKIKPLFITLDPQRDSPAQLKAYLSGKLLSVIFMLLEPSKIMHYVLNWRFVSFKLQNLTQE